MIITLYHYLCSTHQEYQKGAHKADSSPVRLQTQASLIIITFITYLLKITPLIVAVLEFYPIEM